MNEVRSQRNCTVAGLTPRTTAARHRQWAAFLVCCVWLGLAGCQTHDGGGGGKNRRAAQLVVFAASSLTEAFGAIEKDFERLHPGVDVKISFAGSQSLRTQIENGAQPQVFASADADQMAALVAKRLVNEPIVFAHNELVIVVPSQNPAGLQTLADLPSAKRLVLAGKSVPAGAYADAMLQSASAEYGVDFAGRVAKRVVSRETHVRQTLQKVILGEADAAIVYTTDAKSAGDKVKTITIPTKLNVVATYPMATVVSSADDRDGLVSLPQLFVDFVRSEAGLTRLREFGFRIKGKGQ